MSNGDNVRNPLGLPAGSVRGILSLLIVVELWLLLLLPESMKVPVPINLYFLMTLVLLFFVSHGKSIATASDPDPSPLYLPGGVLRFLILGGTAGVVGYLYSNYPDRLLERLRPTQEQIDIWPSIVEAYIGGFVVGYLLRMMPFRNHWFFQAISAWIALLSMGALFIELMLQVFIMPTLKSDLDLHMWQAVVTAIVACYFGTRS